MGNAGLAPTATKTPPIDLAPRPLPTFTDWRMAYIGADGRLHAVSLNGQNDSIGSALPVQGVDGTGIWTAGTSPNGQILSFFYPSQLTLIDATSGDRQTLPLPLGDTSLSWSPDQQYVALNDQPSVLCVSITNGKLVTIPLQSSVHPWIGGPYGWLDATHLLVDDRTAPTKTPSTLESLNITSNSLHSIATLPIPPDESAFTVAPGGAFILASDEQYQNAPFTPVVDVINNATGVVTPLPHLASILPALGGFTQVLWRPGAMQAIAVTGFPQNGSLRYLLIDLLQDTAVPVRLPGFPEAWSPDGTTLIVASGGSTSDSNGIGFKDIGAVGGGPFQVSAVAVDADANVGAATVLTSKAIDIPLLGFVRTAVTAQPKAG